MNLRINLRTLAFGWRRLIAALLLCEILSPPAIAQDNFVAIPPTETSHYQIDFRIFFPSPEAEKADRASLYAAVQELESLKGKVTSSPDNLERALKLDDQVSVQSRKHYGYLYLRNAVNTSDEASLAESSALSAEVGKRTAFLRQELISIDDRTLADFVARRPLLKRFVFAIESARRFRPYTLSLPQEELLSANTPDNSWPAELYDQLRAQSQATRLQRDLFAFTLTRLAATRARWAQLRHFADAATEVYFKSYLTRSDVEDLVAKIGTQAEIFRRYQRMRAEHLRRAADIEPPRYTIAQASEIIRNALAPLGPEYGRELAALLNPANGRMDIVPGEHRRSAGFSQGFIGTDSVFYSAGFSGSYNDVRILTHESTHAVHRQLMNSNQVLPDYAEGPHYLFEAFAIFNEFLLPDYLYNHESDARRRQFYLERFLEGKGTIMFVVAPEVLLEHAVYDGVQSGAIKGADELDALSQRVFAKYFTVATDDQLKARWMSISLMYEDPFYDVNYIYGALLALKFYEMYTRDAGRFVPRYIALMRNGFDAPPAILLKRFLDIDLQDPKLVSNALNIVEAKVNLLEKSYQNTER